MPTRQVTALSVAAALLSVPAGWLWADADHHTISDGPAGARETRPQVFGRGRVTR